MEFDSHTSSVVLTAAALVNALTPGESGGRPHPAPAGDALLAAARQVVAESRWAEDPISAEEAAELQEAAIRLRVVFEVMGAGEIDWAAETLNELMSRWDARPVLSRHDGEPWHLHFHAHDAPLATGWAAGLATGLAVVVGGEHADRLGVCCAPVCDRVYVDVSRNGTKRFCSTSCQNRVKAAAFRARHTAPTA